MIRELFSKIERFLYGSRELLTYAGMQGNTIMESYAQKKTSLASLMDKAVNISLEFLRDTKRVVYDIYQKFESVAEDTFFRYKTDTYAPFEYANEAKRRKTLEVITNDTYRASALAQILTGYTYHYNGDAFIMEHKTRNCWRWSERLDALQSYASRIDLNPEDVTAIDNLMEGLDSNKYLRYKKKDAYATARQTLSGMKNKALRSTTYINRKSTQPLMAP